MNGIIAAKMDAPRSSASGSFSQRGPAAFVGRERELAALTERLDSAARGEGGVILLSGEPGVGKTSLMLEAGAAAEAKGWLVLLGHAYDSQGMPPYLPFIEALQEYVRLSPIDTLEGQLGEGAADLALLLPEVRRRLPGLPAGSALDNEGAAYRLAESVSDFLARIAGAAPAGLLLCLDDLHWADDSTLVLLEHLTRRLSSTPVLILATYRDTELDVARPLARTLEQLAR